MAADVKIDIAAEFTGKKAFRQAETATDKMSKNVKKLAGTLGLAFGGQAILSYGKKAIKAAAEDEKAQKQLALALKNVGLERDAASTEAYIQNLQSEFGILDDKLRPAYQTLAIATQDTAESQRLLNLSLDIAASTGKDLGSVTSALSRAYLGNNTALSKLGVGISKADLKAKSFQEITNELQGTFAGSATQAANTFQGSIDKLGVAAANASEIIGTGLLDAIRMLGEDGSVSNLATAMEDVATYTADAIRGVGVLVATLKSIPGAGVLFDAFKVFNRSTPLGLLVELGKQARINAEKQGTSSTALAHLAELQSRYATETLAAKKKLTTEELKALKAARLKAALEKANLALGKGQEVFDIEKIQNEAALKSQAEALGKATTSSQVLQIANDTARLNVKKSIFALEDAMAAKDEAAIVAATKKLNADLGILGVLGMQNVKLVDIKTILDSLKPKDLINLMNLEAALALLGKINVATGGSTGGASSLGAGSMPSSLNPIKGAGGVRAPRAFTTSELQYFDTAGDYLYAGSPLEAMFAAGSSGSSGTAGNTIIVNTGVGDPNAIAEAIDQVLTDAFQRGTLRQYATP
jgi:hypothetical protein